jgi:hypothetical protein
MRHARGGSDENYVAVIRRRECNVRFSALTDDRSPFAKREMAHRPRRFASNSGKGRADFGTYVSAARIDIDAGPHHAFMIEQKCRLFAVAHYVGKRESGFILHVVTA